VNYLEAGGKEGPGQWPLCMQLVLDAGFGAWMDSLLTPPSRTSNPATHLPKSLLVSPSLAPLSTTGKTFWMTTNRIDSRLLFIAFIG